MTAAEMQSRGWTELDILIISGDAYTDHPSFGPAMIGRVLEADGWRVGIIAQPDWTKPETIQTMGRPRLFCGVSAGNLDSMLSNYTAARHKRRDDDFTENGETGRRPNHACVVYAQLAKRAFPGLPVVLGGLEASLRRIAHYDYWEDKLRPSILSTSKADLLVYGMGENTIAIIARRLDQGKPLAGIRGTARLLKGKESDELDISDIVALPSWDKLKAEPKLLLEMTRNIEREQNPFCGKSLVQMHGSRAVLVEAPAAPATSEELDRLYALPFTRLPHPSYKGRIPAFDMIKNSITITRGCAGGCSFCGLGLHQGKFLSHRSIDSVLDEIHRLAESDTFRGTVTDVGGPTANLYGCGNGISEACKRCRRPSCFFPTICKHFDIQEETLLALLKQAADLPEVKHLFTASGIRIDVALKQPEYLRKLIRDHVSGHLKVAPEHLHPDVLMKMRKPAGSVFRRFMEIFQQISRDAGKEQYLVPYFISSFPGCTPNEMQVVEQFLRENNWNLQQVQDFIPLPMTPAAAMYVTGLDYETGKPIAVARGTGARKQQQKSFRPNRKGRGSRKNSRRRRS